MKDTTKELATRKGAPRPADSSTFWNEWAANNPQPEAKALAEADIVIPIRQFVKGVTTGARSVDF